MLVLINSVIVNDAEYVRYYDYIYVFLNYGFL